MAALICSGVGPWALLKRTLTCRPGAEAHQLADAPVTPGVTRAGFGRARGQLRGAPVAPALGLRERGMGGEQAQQGWRLRSAQARRGSEGIFMAISGRE